MTRAESWLSELRESLSHGETDRVETVARTIDAIEAEASRFRSMAQSTSLTSEERKHLIARLRELGAEALACAGLSENGVMYARLGQSLSNPSTEYAPDGTTETRPVGRVQWEV